MVMIGILKPGDISSSCYYIITRTLGPGTRLVTVPINICSS